MMNRCTLLFEGARGCPPRSYNMSKYFAVLQLALHFSKK